MSQNSTHQIGWPQPLLKHRSHGPSLHDIKSKTGIYAFPRTHDTRSPHSSTNTSNIANTFSQMLLHIEAMRRSFRACAPHGVVKAAGPFFKTVKNLVAQLKLYPDHRRPSAAFHSAQYCVLISVDAFTRSVPLVKFNDTKFRCLLRRAEDRLDMSIAAIYSLMQLSIHELEEYDRRKEEESHPSHSTPIMSAEQEAAHKADNSDRPLSYFLDNAKHKPVVLSEDVNRSRTRKNTLLTVIRNISNLSLRKANSSATLLNQSDHISQTTPTHLRSKCKANLMLGNIRHSMASMPQPMRDSMARFVVSSVPLEVEQGGELPYTEYLPDNSLHKANIRGLVAVITSSCGAENQEFVAMVLMTFRLFTNAVKLAEALLLRYKEQPPADLPRGQVYVWREVSDRVRQRVVVILHQWFDQNWKPEDCEAFDTLFLLVHNYVGQDCPADRDALLESLNAIQSDPHHYHGSRYLSADRPAPTLAPPTKLGLQWMNEKPPIQDPFNILQFASSGAIEEFARQLTVCESHYYHQTCPDDYVHSHRPGGQAKRKAWGNYDYKLSSWVMDTLVSPNTARERARVFNFWISVAKKCAELRNYSSSYAILVPLSFDDVRGMTCTTREISVKGIKAYRYLVDLFGQEKWWKEMSLSNEPAIPSGYFLGRWRETIQETGGKYLSRRLFTHKAPLLDGIVKKDQIDVDGFLNLADLIWDLEYTYAAHNFTVIPWVQQLIADYTANEKYTNFYMTAVAYEAARKETAMSANTSSSWESILDRARHRRIKPMPLKDPDDSKGVKVPKKRRELAAPPLPVDAAARIAKARR